MICSETFERECYLIFHNPTLIPLFPSLSHRLLFKLVGVEGNALGPLLLVSGLSRKFV